MRQSLGFKWISEQTGIEPVQPFRVVSSQGAVRKSLQGSACKVPNKLADEFQLLAEAEVAQNVVKTIRDVFSDGGPEGAGE